MDIRVDPDFRSRINHRSVRNPHRRSCAMWMQDCCDAEKRGFWRGNQDKCAIRKSFQFTASGSRHNDQPTCGIPDPIDVLSIAHERKLTARGAFNHVNREFRRSEFRQSLSPKIGEVYRQYASSPPCARSESNILVSAVVECTTFLHSSARGTITRGSTENLQTG